MSLRWSPSASCLVLATCSLLLGTAPAVDVVTASGQVEQVRRLAFGDGEWRLDDRVAPVGRVAVAIYPLVSPGEAELDERVVTRTGAVYSGRLLAERALAGVTVTRPDGDIRVARDNLSALVLRPLDDDAVVAERPEGEHVILCDGRVVPGKVAWMTVALLGMETEAGDMRFPVSQVHRVELGATPTSPGTGAMTLRSRNGEVFHGRLQRLDGEAAVVASPDGEIRIDTGALIGIWAAGLQPLTARRPDRIAVTPYLDFVHPPAFGRSLSGGALAVGGLPCDDGIAVHSRSVLRYDRSEGRHLVTVVGLDTGRTDAGDAEMALRVGGEERWRERIRGEAVPRVVSVPLTGGPLELVCDYGAHGSGGDHGVWAWPVVLP